MLKSPFGWCPATSIQLHGFRPPQSDAVLSLPSKQVSQDPAHHTQTFGGRWGGTPSWLGRALPPVQAEPHASCPESHLCCILGPPHTAWLHRTSSQTKCTGGGGFWGPLGPLPAARLAWGDVARQPAGAPPRVAVGGHVAWQPGGSVPRALEPGPHSCALPRQPLPSPVWPAGPLGPCPIPLD